MTYRIRTLVVVALATLALFAGSSAQAASHHRFHNQGRQHVATAPAATVVSAVTVSSCLAQVPQDRQDIASHKGTWTVGDVAAFLGCDGTQVNVNTYE